jgi:hypothetical protein
MERAKPAWSACNAFRGKAKAQVKLLRAVASV